MLAGIPFNAEARRVILSAKEAALKTRRREISAQDLHDAVHHALPREDNVWQMIEEPENVSFVNKATGEILTFAHSLALSALGWEDRAALRPVSP